MAFLVARDGPDAGKRYDLDGEEWIVGRHPDCHVVVDVGAVSRHHAKLSRDGEAFFVEDLKSRNHTYVNEEQVAGRRQLQHGDRVSLCDVSFVFHADSKPLPDDDPNSDLPIFVDDEGSTTSSTIMSKLGMTSSQGSVQLSSSPEAKLQALLEISSNLGRALALDDVLPTVLDCMFRIFVQADRGYIALADDEGKLIPRWSKARREDVEDFRVSRTIARTVMESKEAILSVDAAMDERFDMAQSIADFRIRSMMCAPLLDSDGNSMGVLQIDTVDQRKRFQQEDLEVLVAVAVQASTAIDNARLHEQSLRQQALERDLELAHEVQKGFLPDKQPDLPGYAFSDFYQPANHIGGDYYDYVPLPDDRTAVIVADVVGHGVAAALLMAKLAAETKFCLATFSRPDEAVTQLNNRLSGVHIDRFVTMVMAVIDHKNNELTIVNAGHMPPIIRRANGSIEEPGSEASGLPLGIMGGFEYEQHSVDLGSGDVITMYTDGLNESADADDEIFGIQRVKDTIQQVDAQPEVVNRTLVDAVGEFAVAQDDDMCVVTFGRTA